MPAAIVLGVLFAAVPTEERLCEIDGDIEVCTTPTGGALAALLLVGLALLLVVLAYFIVPIGRRGATIGQRAMGIQVVDAVNGAPIGSGRATGRYLMSILSGSVCYLGYLWMLWDDRKQTWHDKVVNSVVVKR